VHGRIGQTNDYWSFTIIRLNHTHRFVEELIETNATQQWEQGRANGIPVR
jgi:hypothetical protein